MTEDIVLDKSKEFYEELNDCVKILRGKKLNKSNKYKFQKKVRKVIARYFQKPFSEVASIKMERSGNEMLVKYPMDGNDVTIINFEIIEP